MDLPFVYIVILNWNGWRDTIECLESVFRLNCNKFRVIVCDNASSDDSVEIIKTWAEGGVNVYVPQTSTLRQHSFPPLPKPIPYREYSRRDAELGGQPDDVDFPLIVIQNGDNLGFAGGNNIALRYATARNNYKYLWILNNDTVVKPDALEKLINRAEISSDCGICGSQILYYHDPELIQAMGGAKYYRWKAEGEHLLCNEVRTISFETSQIETQIDYILGASMLVSRDFIADVGLMNEIYFLYFEEIDWSRRNKKYSLRLASDSIVYHKEGASIGTNRKSSRNSIIAEYFLHKNQLLFTWQYEPRFLLTIIIKIYLKIIKRIFTFEFTKAAALAHSLIFWRDSTLELWHRR